MDIFGWIAYIGLGLGILFLIIAALIAIGLGGECHQEENKELYRKG